MAAASAAWLLVVFLLAQLFYQNADLDLWPIACSRSTLQQLSDILAFFAPASEPPEWLDRGGEGALKRIWERCGVSSDSRVLEVGFSSGRLAETLLQEVGVKSYDGLELSEGWLNVTTRRVSGEAFRRMHLFYSENPAAFLHESEELAESYSHSFALFALDAWSFADVEALLRELHARAEEGGRLCLATLADVPSTSVRMYKTLWRSLPLLLGGRRPVQLQRVVADSEWSAVDSWTEEGGWLPIEVVVLEAVDPPASIHRAAAPAKRAAILQRWGELLSITTGTAIANIKDALIASVQQLPRGIVMDVFDGWLGDLSEDTLLTLVKRDVSRMKKDEILEARKVALKSASSATLLKETELWVQSLDTKTLEEIVDPPIDELDTDSLREHLGRLAQDAARAVKGDSEIFSEVLAQQDLVAEAKSREDLLQVSKWLYSNVLLPASEMSRDELERAVLENTEMLSREELEEEMMMDYEASSEEELREALLEDLVELQRDGLEGRVLGAVDFGVEVSWLWPAVEEVAKTLLTPEDLAVVTQSAPLSGDAPAAPRPSHSRSARKLASDSPALGSRRHPSKEVSRSAAASGGPRAMSAELQYEL